MNIFIWVLKIIGILIGLFVLELAIVAFFPGFSVPEQKLHRAKKKRGKEVELVKPKETVNFSVKGISISAWLYLPSDLSKPVPCIVMGNGLGGTKEMLLESYAARYQKSGFAVLAFDYRCFGESEGEPRHLIWIPYQLEDYSAAVEYARSRKEIDPDRIALWGTSFSGGHVIVIASKDNKIACVSAQCPGLDGRASSLAGLKRMGWWYSIRMMMHGQRDLIRSLFKLSPHKIPIAGKPGSIALMADQDAFKAFNRMVPEDYINEACARINIRGDKYRPVEYANKVKCPVLLQICDKDYMTPLSAAEETAKRLGEYAEVKHYPIGHFDIYIGDNFEKAVKDQLGFFKKHLFESEKEE
jgi:fermentation-respiration switch protein FrsA (DUF1100 family)